MSTKYQSGQSQSPHITIGHVFFFDESHCLLPVTFLLSDPIYGLVSESSPTANRSKTKHRVDIIRDKY